MDLRIARLERQVSSYHHEETATVKATSAVLLDDLSQVISELKAVRHDSSMTKDDMTQVISELKAMRHDSSTTRLINKLYPLIEGIVAVYSTISPGVPYATMRSWAISPDLGSYLVQLTMRSKPHLVFETGSGVSTILFGMAMKANGFGRVIALEHDDKTQPEPDRHGFPPVFRYPSDDTVAGQRVISWSLKGRSTVVEAERSRDRPRNHTPSRSSYGKRTYRRTS